MQEVRNKILNTMASMSDTIDASKDYLEIYRDDQKLFERAEDLYIAVLNAVEGMILWIDESAYSMTPCSYVRSIKIKEKQKK